MASIVTNLTCELTAPVSVVFLPGNMFSMDNGGNIINVFVVQNGEPVALGGSVSANVIRSDGTTVAITGALEGNKAYIILPQACYAVPGIIHIVMKITEGTTITTIAAVTANVYQSSTDAVVDPGTLVPSIAALIEAIEDAVDSIPVDYSGLLATLAADYSTSKTYKVGDYAWYGGVLKRCISPITTAESYTAAHWTNAVIGDDLSALKSAFEPITGNGIIEMVRNAQITYSGATLDLNGITSRAGRNCAIIECSAGNIFTINGTSGTTLRLYAFYDANDPPHLIEGTMAPANATGNNTQIIAPANAKYLAINDLSGQAVSFYGKLLSKTVSEIQTQTASNTANITQNTDDIAKITTDLTDITREIGLTNITGWQSGAISGGTNANIASAVANPTASSVFEYAIVECSPGDVFTINANSGTSPKAFYFTDDSYNVLTRGDKGSYTDYVIAAPETSSYLVINKNVSNTKNSYKGAIQNGLNITGVGSDNMIWSWATYPGIVSFNRVRNKVYWGYTSADGYRGIASYDFDTKETVKNNLFRGQIDDHNSTAVHVCSDGTIICGFSTGHNYDYCMHIRRSSVPECIEQFDDDIIVAGIGETSYCQFASYGSRLYMFYRISNTIWLHRLSTDNGLTWSAPTQIVSSAEKMYIKIVPTTTETRMRILLFNNSTYDDSEIRQGFFDLTNGNIYNSDNSTLLGTSGLSITDFTVLIPLDSTLTHTRFFDAAITAPGSPLIAYCVFEQGDDSEYRIFDNGSVTATFVGGYGLLNYYQLGMAWRGTSQIVVAHGVGADGGTDLVDLYDYADGVSTFNKNLDSVIRGSVPVRLARPIVDQAGKVAIWQRGYYNRSDYTDFNMDARMHIFE